ncbi:MAG: fibronectin type III domain-containing protein [Lachnospiraceae bacterium]|nr:fibronectin type III domain-containing protein [Lachnospiraceae bacterium]
MKRKLFMLLLSTTLVSSLFMEAVQPASASRAEEMVLNATTPNTPFNTTPEVPTVSPVISKVPEIPTISPIISEAPDDSEALKDISKAVVSKIASLTYTGKAQKPSITLTWEGKTVPKEMYTISYKNNINAGKAQIIIKGKGGFTGKKQITFTILPRNIAKANCSKISDKVYSGKAIKPAVTVKYKGTALKKNKDYKVTYTNNKQAGKATVTIKGKGNYKGSKSVTFRILPKKVSSFKKEKCSATSVMLKWKKSASVSGYQIYQYDEATKKYKLKKTLPAKSTSYTIKNLSPYTGYQFKIRGYKKVGAKKYYGKYSKVVKVQTLLETPEMTAASNGMGQATIQFKQVKNATGFELSYKEGEGTFAILADGLKNIDNALYIRKLTEGAVYTFRMRAYVEQDGKKTYGDYCIQTVTISSQSSGPVGGNYTPGSVYGPKLTQAELNQVKEKVQYFKDHYIDNSMPEYVKVKIAHDYLASVCSYAPDWSLNRANTAWGALIYGEAQCSGYARAMKALCDGIGVECYYVHANNNSINPSHQWNEVKVDGNWYIVDVQCNDLSGFYAFFLVSDSTYETTGMDWDRQSVPACPKDY